jgi:ABC-type multidrug transport system ATPase subunit/ABC-type multidrug transport system permease subunit
VRLNNYRVDPNDIKIRKKIAFVAQDDSLQVTSTPREAIRFSARMRLPKKLSDSSLERLTNTMLAELGLERCADTLVGGALLKGISGGERKRTSVGVELVTRPALVFLDEPTSGLDSFNAVQLCQLLGKISKAGTSVLFTIHQPSSKIFNAFDRLILLNLGRVMYQGPVEDCPEFFKQRGFPNPQNYNVADWIMDVALSHPIEKLDKAKFFPADERQIAEPFQPEKNAEKDALGITNHFSDCEESGRGIPAEIRLLFARERKNVVRNTHALKARTGMTCMISFLTGCIFYKVAETDFDEFINVQSTFGALLMSLLSNVFSTALPSLTAFPEERPVFLREYSTNHYSVVSYFCSRLVMELFVTAVQVTVSSMITYLLVGFSANYGIFWGGLYLMACSSTAIGVLVGSSVENPSVAVEFLPAVFMPQILFSGFFVPPELIPVWLRWLRWVFPLTYGVRIVMGAEFDGRCDQYDPPNLCDEVLDNVGIDPDDTWWYFLVLASLFTFFRLFALMMLKRKSEKFY